jgi:hypothetical protein
MAFAQWIRKRETPSLADIATEVIDELGTLTRPGAAPAGH